jgi:hypothetical protein
VFLLNRPSIDGIDGGSLTLVDCNWDVRVPRMRTVLKHMEGERGGGDGGWGVDDIREDMTMTRSDTGVGNCEISRIVDTSGWDFKFEIKPVRAKHKGISPPAICRHSLYHCHLHPLESSK